MNKIIYGWIYPKDKDWVTPDDVEEFAYVNGKKLTNEEVKELSEQRNKTWK